MNPKACKIRHPAKKRWPKLRPLPYDQAMKPVAFTLVAALLGLSVLPAAFATMMFLFLFDAPGSESNLLNYAMFGSALLYPAFVVVGLVRGFLRRKSGKGAWLNLLGFPLVPAVVFAVSVLLFVTVCGGKSVCHF